MMNQVIGEEGVKRISRWVVVVLVLLTAFLSVKTLGDLKRLPRAGMEVYPQSTITVTGEGEAYAIPDIASFNFTVTELAANVKDAQSKLDQKINDAIASVKEGGVEEKDIKTTNYNVYPKYEWEQVHCAAITGVACPPGKNVLKGYEVSQTISVKVRDTEKAADLVTKVGAVNVSNISGVEFTVDDRESFVAQAREEAIKNAKEKAKKLSKDLDVRLGRILYYNDNAGPYPMYAEGMGGAAMDVRSSVAPAKAVLPTGESKITSSVSITYELK